MKNLFLMALLFTMLSCSKNNAENRDKIKPVLTIIAPAISEIYRTGDPLCFKGDIIDNGSISNASLKLFRASDMYRPVVQYSYSVSASTYHVEEKIIIPAELNGDCILQFEANDFQNNRAVSTMNFSSN